MVRRKGRTGGTQCFSVAAGYAIPGLIVDHRLLVLARGIYKLFGPCKNLNSTTNSLSSANLQPSTLTMGKKDKQAVLIDSHVPQSQCKKAITALVKHATKIAKQKEETELIPGKEENVWLVLSVKKVVPEKKLKPYKMCVANMCENE